MSAQRTIFDDDYRGNTAICPTKNYSMFRYRFDNREICMSHVRRLMSSIEQDNNLHLNPIIVNDKFEVIDGQHRLEAAKQLNIPIFYVIDTHFNEKKMILLNSTQRQWKPQDYMDYWVSHGLEDYKKLKHFVTEVKMTLSNALVWILGKKKNYLAEFKEGRFKFHIDNNTARAMVSASKLIRILREDGIRPQTIFSHGHFHKAAKMFFTNPLVNHELFFTQLNKCPYKISLFATWQEYLDRLISIYNYSIKSKNKRIKMVTCGSERELTK